MSKLTIKIIILFSLFFLIDRIVGNYIFSQKQSENRDKRISRVINKDLNFDILILGSSRSARNIMAYELTKKTDLSAYNLGFPGSNIDFHLQLLKLIIESGSCPKFVVLAVDDLEFIENKSLNFRYDVLYKYANDNKIKSILAERGKFDNILSNISVTYCARYIAIDSLTDFFKSVLKRNPFNDPLNIILHDGSMPIETKSITWDKMTYNELIKYDNKNESEFLIDKYKQFVETCRANDINLLIVFPPNYQAKSDNFVTRIKELSGKYVHFFDYSTEVTDKSLFYDSSHLNKEGAFLLSKKFARDLDEYLNR